MNVLVVVQARLGSSRLPGKVLLPVLGEPVLVRQLDRIRAAQATFQLVVATTTEPADEAIVQLCQERGIPVFRGHPTDVLDRHYQAAVSYHADVVVKIPSDCPLIDPAVIDTVLGYFLLNSADFDFVSNLQPPTWPDGNDVEVMSFAALQTAWREAKKPFEREHTTPFIWDNRDQFRVGNVAWSTGQDLSQSHRWVLDYQLDYQFIATVFERLLPSLGSAFSLEQILDLLAREPELASINQAHLGVCWQQKHSHELKTLHQTNGALTWTVG